MAVHLFGTMSSASCANFVLYFVLLTVRSTLVQKRWIRFYAASMLMIVRCLSLRRRKQCPFTMCLVPSVLKVEFSLQSGLVTYMVFLPQYESHGVMEVKNVNMDPDVLSVDRVLGVKWCIQSDTFKLITVIKDRPLTRRGILSTIRSIYDPFGILSPVVLSTWENLKRA